MANKLILKRSSVASKVPLATDLEPGELAVNLTDQKLYSKKTDGTVILVGSGLGGAGDVQGPASATDNAVARFDGATGKIIQNSSATIDDSGNITSPSTIATGTSANKVPVGTTAQRPASPSAGQIRFNSTTGQYEGYNGVGWVQLDYMPVLVEYVVVAGGGGGGNGVVGNSFGGGGGAGGYRSSVTGESSGRGAPAEPALELLRGVSYQVTVGAGGAAAVKGGDSTFATIVSEGGGLGANSSGTSGNGGSGGGRPWAGARGFGTTGQGYDGSNFNSGGAGGGGGGAGSESTTSAGGLGVASSITGSSVTRAAGGGSGTEGSSAANTGNGGNSPNSTRVGLPGGSGVVIIRYPSIWTVSNPGGGLTFSTATVGSNKVTTFTAGTGNIAFS